MSITEKEKILTPNFLALFGAVFLMFTAVDFFIPVLPFYVLDAGGSEAAVGMLMGLFTFCSVVLRPFQGRNLNRSGRKRLLVAGIVLYAAAGLGLLFLPSLPLLFLIRAIQGFGWGAFLLSFNTLTLDLAPPKKRGEVLGLMGIAPPISLAMAPLISEQMRIATSSNYMVLFLVTSMGALLALLLGSLVREPKMHKQIDEKPSLFSRKVLIPSLIIFCMTFNLGSILTFLPLFGEIRNIHAVGYFFTLFALTTVISRPLAGRLSDRFGRPKIYLPGLIIAALAMIIIAFSYSARELLLGAVILGIGFGSAHSSVMALAADRLPVIERGVGMATFTTAFDLGIVAGSIVFGFLLSWFDFTAIFILCALIMVAPVAGLLLKQKPHLLS
ncbi:MAG: MFS transporter [Dethiobacteria bacterium]